MKIGKPRPIPSLLEVKMPKDLTLHVSVEFDEKNLKRVEAIAKNFIAIKKLLAKNLKLKTLDKKDKNAIKIIQSMKSTATLLGSVLEGLIKPVQTK